MVVVQKTAPIQICWLWIVGRPQLVRDTKMPDGLDPRNPAKQTCIEDFSFCLEKYVPGTLLKTHLTNPATIFGSLYDGWSFFQTESERFLYIDILAGIHGVDGSSRVPMIRCGNQHDINVLLFQHLTMVSESPGTWRILLSPDGLLSEYVTDCCDFNRRGSLKNLHQIGTTIPTTNHSEIDTIVCAQDMRVVCSRERDDSSSNSPQKMSTTHSGTHLTVGGCNH